MIGQIIIRNKCVSRKLSPHYIRGDKLSSYSQNKISTVQPQNSSGVVTSTPECSGVRGSTACPCLRDNVSQSIFVLPMYRELHVYSSFGRLRIPVSPKFIYYKCGILPMCQDGIIKTKVKARDCGDLFHEGKPME